MIHSADELIIDLFKVFALAGLGNVSACQGYGIYGFCLSFKFRQVKEIYLKNVHCH